MSSRLAIKVFRLPFLFLAMLCLLVGLWSGLTRIGWDLGLLPLTMHHGAIMVGGFLGTLISLEKIIPLKRKSLFAIPVVSAASMLFFALNEPLISFYCLVLASAGLCAVFVYYQLKEKNLIYLLMAGGSICWLIGNIALISKRFYPAAFPWWLAFALLIIVSERLELMKFLPITKRHKLTLVLLLMLYLAGIMFPFHGPGNIISGAALVAVSLWLLRNDIIGIALHKKDLPKFVAVALMCGYIGMMFAGVLSIAFRDQPYAYDAVVHTFFLGFVFSMIFAHGPIILPGVLGISFKPYHPLLYVWLFFLHLSWVMRLAGDLVLSTETRKLSAMMSATTIFCYFLTMAISIFAYQSRHAKVL
jgi:hypothetical protein